MAIRRNITADDEFFLGEDKTLPLQVFQKDKVTPQDISGWGDIRYLLKTHKDALDADALVQKSLADGIEITDGANGWIVITYVQGDTDGNSELSARIKPRVQYWYSVKRHGTGVDTVLTHGTHMFLDAGQRKA